MSDKKLKIQLAADGLVLNKGVHDAEITEVKIDGDSESEKVARISCKAENGDRFTVGFQGVDFFSLDYFGHQNVIQDITVISKADPTRLLKNVSSMGSYSSKRLGDIVEKIKAGDLVFVSVVPATGCEINVICRKIEIREV